MIRRTYQECLDIAKTYQSIGDWQRKHEASYRSAYRRGWHLKIATEIGWKPWKRHTFTKGDKHGQ